jgi:hypothetical protein
MQFHGDNIAMRIQFSATVHFPSLFIIGLGIVPLSKGFSEGLKYRTNT